jgi:3-hydroxyisobutyrate dehydrogenase
MHYSRVLRSAEQQVRGRSRTIGFIGLGQMGSRMAYNLFSKHSGIQTSGTTLGRLPYFVCDAIPNAAEVFCSAFESKHPGAKVEMCTTPAEWVSIPRCSL